MLKRSKNRKSAPTDLSWEEKNPASYIYRPSKAMIRLRNDTKKKRVSKGRSLRYKSASHLKIQGKSKLAKP